MTLNILLVDDDAIDVRHVQRAFRNSGVDHPLTVVGDGEQALAVLRGENGRAPLPRPYIILLDINMPRMDGHEFLAELRNDKKLRDTVVFVMTTSSDEADRHKAYAQHVAGYVLKQDPRVTYVDTARMLDLYSRVVLLP